ncbi:MAG: hypothetical protein M3443_12455, partial [Actinomycetota bacterium]|nr:hypothetical protein [Actinomycetota bacterium]
MSDPDGDPRAGQRPPPQADIDSSYAVPSAPAAQPFPGARYEQEQKNSPLVLIAVLGMVIAGVLTIALIGKAMSGGLTTTVSGTPLTVGEIPSGRVSEGPRSL